MIHSMTGYGSSKAKKGNLFFSIEAKSLNSKFLDIYLKMPEGMDEVEDRIKAMMQEKLERGRVSLVITEETDMPGELEADVAQAKKYYAAIRKIKSSLKIPGNPSLDLIMGLPQVLKTVRNKYTVSAVWPVLSKGIAAALDSLIAARKKEGATTYKILVRHADAIQSSIFKIEEIAPQAVKFYKEKLERTLSEFVPELNLSNPRLAEELTLFASKVDFSEEVTRLKLHLNSFRETLEKTGSVGRRLDFMVQEMSREINTLSSKANSFPVSSQSVLVKEELEKMREQVQNVE